MSKGWDEGAQVLEEQLDKPQENRNRLILLVILVLPLLSILAATFVYKTGIGLPESTWNKGVLVQPPRQIDDIEIFQHEDKPFRYAEQKWAWTFLIPGSARCEDKCQQTLWLTRQVHTILSQRSKRVRRYYLNVDDRNNADIKSQISTELDSSLRQEHPGLEVLHVTGQEFDKLLAGIEEPLRPIEDNLFFVVDPKGFVMMYYTPQHDGKAVIKDVKFLLKQSGEH